MEPHPFAGEPSRADYTFLGQWYAQVYEWMLEPPPPNTEPFWEWVLRLPENRHLRAMLPLTEEQKEEVRKKRDECLAKWEEGQRQLVVSRQIMAEKRRRFLSNNQKG